MRQATARIETTTRELNAGLALPPIESNLEQEIFLCFLNIGSLQFIIIRLLYFFCIYSYLVPLPILIYLNYILDLAKSYFYWIYYIVANLKHPLSVANALRKYT